MFVTSSFALTKMVFALAADASVEGSGAPLVLCERRIPGAR